MKSLTMLKRLSIILMVLMSMSVCASYAAASSLADLIPEMLENHERLKAAQDTQKAGEHRYKGGRAAWYPKVDLSGDFANEGTDTNKQNGIHLMRNMQKLRATQLLLDFGKTDGVVSQLESAWRQSVAGKKVTRQTLILEGVTAYLNLMKTDQVLGFSLKSEENIKHQTGIEEMLVEKGAGLSSDVLQAKSQLAAAAALRVASQGDFANAKNRFRAVFGFEAKDSDVAAFSYPTLPTADVPATLDEAISVALKENPQLEVARQAIKTAEGAKEAALGTFYPTLNAFYEHWRKENDGGARGVVKFEERLGVEFSYNIFNGGGDWENLKAAKKDVSAGINTAKDLERTIEEQVRTSWQNLITAKAKAEWFSNQANIEGEFLELARKERKLGNRSLLDVLTAEVNHINAKSGAIAAQIDHMIEMYNLLFAMGRLDTELVRQ